jgi:hypothetical protein
MVSRIRARQSPTQAVNVVERSLCECGPCFHEMRQTGSDGLVAPRGNAARIDTMLQQTRRKRCLCDLVSEFAYLFILAERRYECLELYGGVWKDVWLC